MTEPDRRLKNWEWFVTDENGDIYENKQARVLAVLMDIRDELQGLRAQVRTVGNDLSANRRKHSKAKRKTRK